MKHMKNSILILLVLSILATAATAVAETLPADLAEAFDFTRMKGWSVACWETGENTAAVILQKSKTNRLCVLSHQSGDWKLTVSSDEAIYQGSRLPARMEVSDTAINLWYANAKSADNLIRFAVNKNIWRLSRLEIWDKSLKYDTIHVYSDKLVFQRTTGDEQEVTVEGVTCRDLAYVDFPSFPLTPEKASQQLSNPPAIPQGDLHCQVVDFHGDQRFPLYAGPGKTYYRPNNGKCVVSTNDWIQVFGHENDWLLVQYDRSADKMRFGYIEASALSKSQVSLQDLPPLAFAYTPVRTNQAVSLTDDPLYAQTSLGTLAADREITYLAAMGQWAHVEAQVGSQLMRGFVPLDSLTFEPANAQGLNADFGHYTASGQAVISPENQLTVVLTLSGDATAISAYQVYLDQTSYLLAPIYSVDGQPTISFTLPIVGEPSIIGLCPVDTQGNLLTGQTLTLQPGR